MFSDFETDWYKHWSKLLRQHGRWLGSYQRLANKHWQNAIMAEILHSNGLLMPGRKGIGFGVGKERLPALFSSLGVSVTATDQDYRSANAKLWQREEHAGDIADLNQYGICESEQFKKLVKLTSLDMSQPMPKNLHGKYDFLWSNCALGHLGSIQAELDFITESAKCLLPGGIAVHTTEVNLISNDQTADSGETVLFRPRDLLQLSAKLSKSGLILESPTFAFGNTAMDHRINLSPTFGNDFSKILVNGYFATQIVLIVRKKNEPALLQRYRTITDRITYFRNIRAQERYVATHRLLRQMVAARQTSLEVGDVIPLKKTLRLKLNNSSQDIYTLHIPRQ